MAIYSIGEVARHFGLTYRTLRFYEQQELLVDSIGIDEIAQVVRRGAGLMRSN